MNARVYQNQSCNWHSYMMIMMFLQKVSLTDMLLGQFLYKTCLATFAVTYDVIQSSTNKEETEGVNAEEEMQNTENNIYLTKMKL